MYTVYALPHAPPRWRADLQVRHCAGPEGPAS
jgi:hypothetical protein